MRQLAQANAGSGHKANGKQNAVPGAPKKRRTITRQNEQLMGAWFEWREGIDLLDVPSEQLVRCQIRRGW